MDQADSVLSTPPTNTSATDDPQSPTKPPEGAQEGPLYIPTDVTPEDLFQAIGRLRKEARDEIDRLVRFLDETENHMEREPEDEADDSELEDGADEENSLGSLERHASSYGPDGRNPTGTQTNWSGGRGDDLEEEHDGAEPDEDGEPSLGAFEGHDNQTVAWAGETHFMDVELDAAESGIGDQNLARAPGSGLPPRINATRESRSPGTKPGRGA